MNKFQAMTYLEGYLSKEAVRGDQLEILKKRLENTQRAFEDPAAVETISGSKVKRDLDTVAQRLQQALNSKRAVRMTDYTEAPYLKLPSLNESGLARTTELYDPASKHILNRNSMDAHGYSLRELAKSMRVAKKDVSSANKELPSLVRKGETILKNKAKAQGASVRNIAKPISKGLVDFLQSVLKRVK